MKKYFTLIMFIALSFTAFAKTIFVGEYGNDSNNGTIETPFQSFQKAIDIAEAGDTVFILPGYYKQKLLIKDKKGTSDNPIVVKALGDVVIDSPENIDLGDTDYDINNFGFKISDPDHLYYPYYRGAVIRVENSSFIVIDGLHIQNSPWFGIATLGGDNITIKHCLIHDNGASGIYLLNTNKLTIAFNEIMRCCGFPERIKDHGTQEMISVVNCSEFEVMYNRVHETNNWNWVRYQASAEGGEGIDMKENSHNGTCHHNFVYNIWRPGIYVDAWSSKKNGNIEVYNNVVQNTQNGMALGCENHGKLTNIKIYNNLWLNNWLEGIILAAWASGGEKENISIINNTSFNNWEGSINLGSSMHHDIQVLNNVSYMNRRLKFPEYRQGEARNVTEKNNIFVNPAFVQTGKYDYTVRDTSVAIDAGTEPPFEIKFDLYDAPRVNGKSIDAGAFEYGSVPTGPRVIYVSNQGSDSNPGVFFKPYKTIERAVKELVPGSTLILLPGYYNEKIILNNLKATESNPILIRSMGEVSIKGQGVSSDKNGLLTISKSSYITLDGFKIESFAGASVLLKDTENIEIINCEFKSNSGLNLKCENAKSTSLVGNKLEKDKVANESSEIFIVHSR